MKKFAFLPMLVALSFVFWGCGGESGSHDMQNGDALSSAVQRENDYVNVILLAGEENCLGYAYANRLRDTDERTNVSKEKFAEYKRGYDNVKINYANMRKKDSALTKSDGFVNASIGCGTFSDETGGAFGPELGLAEYLAYAYPDDTTYIIKYAACAPSAMNLQWHASGIHYKEMISFFDGALSMLETSNIDFRVSAFMFVQGESDARYHSDVYYEKLTVFADSVRERFDRYAPECGIAFIDAGIPRYYIGYDKLNDIKKKFAQSDSRNYYIDTVAAGIDTELDNTDRKHYDGISQLKFGNLLGRAFRESVAYVADYSKRMTAPEGAEYTDGEQCGDYSLDVYCDGKFARSKWAFETVDDDLHVIADVTDAVVTADDGIALSVAYSDGTVLDVSLYADGEITVAEGDTTLWADDLGIKGKISYRRDGDELNGYAVELTVPGSDASIDFALVNSDISCARRYYTALGAKHGRPSTYMKIESKKLVAGPYAASGATLGNGGPFEATEGWDLSCDDGGDHASAFMTSGVPDNNIFFRDVCATRLYAEVYITAGDIYNGDAFPKFGIKLTNANGRGFYYYVDAAAVADTPVGTALGYVTFANGSYNNDWTVTGKTVGVTSDVYRNGNYIKLAVYRDGDAVTMFCDDKPVLTIANNFCKLGLTATYVSISSFNTLLSVKDYRVAVGDEVEKFLPKNI